MRDPERIDRILGRIRRLWHMYPDLRLVQLLVNTTTDINGISPLEARGAYFYEDDKLEVALEREILRRADENGL